MDAKFLFVTLTAAATLAFAQQGSGGRGGRPQMDETTKAAFETCATSTGMPARGSGTRPTEAQHEAFKACLKKANISMPEHHGRPPQGDQSGNSPQPPPEE